jgi:DUF4097 and DUF4098 domain-containing protein YvlB
MKNRILLGLCVIISVGTSVALADIEKNIQRTFSVAEGGSLVLDTDTGSVEVDSHSSNEVVIDIVVRANTDRESRAEEWFEGFDLSFDQDGNDVVIKGDLERGVGFFRRNNRLRVTYEITIPQNYNLDLDTSGGSFDIEDVEGNVRLDTSGGSIRLGKVIGNVNAHTSGGSITTEGVVGDMAVSTSGGRLRLNNINGNVVGKTSGGSIRAEVLGQTSEAIELRTSGGSITLALPTDFEADIDATTSGGSVSSELPVLVSGQTKRNTLQGKLNGGGIPILLHTSGGSINVHNL